MPRAGVRTIGHEHQGGRKLYWRQKRKLKKRESMSLKTSVSFTISEQYIGMIDLRSEPAGKNPSRRLFTGTGDLVAVSECAITQLPIIQ